MKKLLSLALALIMVLTLTVAVAAEEPPYNNDESVTIGVSFTGENKTATTPNETFHYTITAGAVIDGNAEGNRTYVQESSLSDEGTSVPMPTIKTYDVAMTPGAEDGSFTIVLPEYSSVGIYYYTVTQTEGNTAGVKYDTRKMIVKVTVIQQEENKVRVAFATASLADKDGNPGTDVKIATFVNTYSAGSLSVKKLVTGNLGDRDKEFNVKVTFTAPTDKEVESVISYTDGTAQTIETSKWTEKNGSNQAVVTITLKHNETVTFTNIPYGVTYEVKEADYTSEANGKYDAAKYDFTDTAKKIDTASDTVTITNNKNSAVDTGIVLDSLPYVLLIAVAVVGVVIFTARKRSHREY